MIEIRPSCIVIHNYEQNKTLERSLSVWDSIYFKVSHSSFFYDPEDETKLIIPKGYNMEKLKRLFPDKKIADNSIRMKNPSRVISFKINGTPRNIRQQNALSFLEASTSYFGYSSGKTQKLLSLETGGGKTFVTISFMSKFKKATMIIVDSDKLIRQWKDDELLRLTDLTKEDIYVISGSDSIRTIIKTPKKHKVYIASHRTLSNYAKNDPYLLGELFKKLGIGLKVFDEAHVEWKNIFTIDAFTNTELTIYLTATPGRSNPLENVVYQNMFEGIVQYGIEHKYKEEENFHKVVYIEYNTKPSLEDLVRLSQGNKHGFDTNSWCNYILDNNYDYFIEVLEKIISMTTKNREFPKIAIVLHTLKMIEKVKESMEELYPNFSIGNFSTLIKNVEERDKELQKQIILTTDKSFDKAINVMNLEVLINTVPLSSKVKIEQMLGRLRYVKGKPTIFFDLTDMGFTACVNQRKYRKQILDLKAKSIYEMKL